MIETGISFGNIHSFYDLNLILSGSKISPAKPKTIYVDIPGGDGSVDLTESVGSVKYYDRDCTFTFSMNPLDDLSEQAWEEKKTEVSNALNGIWFEKIVLDKDDEYYFTGRCEVSEFLSDKRLRQIVVSAKVKPYKLKQKARTVTLELSSIFQEFHVVNSGRKTVLPVISCNDGTQIRKDRGGIYTLDLGSHQIPEFYLASGDNVFYISGTGGIIFTFQEGDL